jgi:hypothetical protein
MPQTLDPVISTLNEKNIILYYLPLVQSDSDISPSEQPNVSNDYSHVLPYLSVLLFLLTLTLCVIFSLYPYRSNVSSITVVLSPFNLTLSTKI